MKGREMPVVSIIGANSTYDVAKFRVSAKSVEPLAIASANAAEGSGVWILPYATKKSPDCLQGRVSKVETFQQGYAYYTIGAEVPESSTSCPVLNDDGEAVGLVQQPADAADTTNYAVSAAFANSLTTNGLSINDATLKSTAIKKELPAQLDQAVLMLYVAASVLDSAGYAAIVEDFVAKFPSAPRWLCQQGAAALRSGPLCRGRPRHGAGCRRGRKKKDDAHFNYAKLIFQKLVYQDSIPYDSWTFDKAAAEARAAYDINPVGVYRQLEAQIRFAQKRYEEAYSLYSQLFAGELRNAETFFAAARCKEMMGDSAAVLALLDSAVCTFAKPYLKAAAPYLLARAQTLLGMKQYRRAVLDFNEYEKLMPTEVNANFYYIRARAETEGRIFQAALNDYAMALQKDPGNTLYLCEKASLEIRVNLLDEAIATSSQCISVAPRPRRGLPLPRSCPVPEGRQGRRTAKPAKSQGTWRHPGAGAYREICHVGWTSPFHAVCPLVCKRSQALPATTLLWPAMLFFSPSLPIARMAGGITIVDACCRRLSLMCPCQGKGVRRPSAATLANPSQPKV